MGACKQDDVVVVIKIVALLMDGCFVWVLTLSYETHHILALFLSRQTITPRVVGDYFISCVLWQGHTVKFSFRIKLC